MSEYTSGTQARDGRKVNHDPEPLCEVASGRRVRKDREPSRGFWVVSPRPEFDVLDNPILIELRQYAHATDLTHAVATLRDCVVFGKASVIRCTPEQAEHGRRVLKKLAALLRRDRPA